MRESGTHRASGEKTALREMRLMKADADSMMGGG
jgi:hypothetical protein